MLACRSPTRERSEDQVDVFVDALDRRVVMSWTAAFSQLETLFRSPSPPGSPHSSPPGSPSRSQIPVRVAGGGGGESDMQ